MPQRKFTRLKAAMYEAGITQPELARATGKGLTYISRRLNGREPFNMEDVRQIGTLLQLERAHWLDYFMDSL